nr:IS1595 family transposase [Alicyclobacillus mali (ex Roth et al. 2021)]
MARFADEKACEEHLIKLRWKDGFVCPKCSHTSATLVHAKHRRDADQRAPLFECTRCHRQTSVTAGTIFHKTKIPLNKWFLAVYLVANDKRGVAATTLSRHLDVSYPTAWLMLKKIRKAMAERNARYKLGGLVQVDDFYLGGVSHGDGKSGRGTDQDTVLIGVSIQRGGAPAHCFMERVDDMSAQTVSEVLSRRLAPGVTLETDGYPTYAACAKDLNVTHIVTKSSAFRLLEWLREHRPTSYMAAYLAIHTGMRMGEIAGLQWRDIDLDTGLIQLERTRYRPKGGQDFLGPPKTFGSRRRIVVTREVVDELRRWKQSQQEIERESWTPESFVVRLPNSAPPSPASFNNAIQIARKELGLPPVSFHGLRHTHATWLLESGVDLKVVSERLGHSSITVTADIYAHVTDALQREAIEKLQRMMRSRRANNADSDDDEDL